MCMHAGIVAVSTLGLGCFMLHSLICGEDLSPLSGFLGFVVGEVAAALASSRTKRVN